jgi:glyoxylase-like metal-dependent hydrolase (beta-lactamase superfamily II)
MKYLKFISFFIVFYITTFSFCQDKDVIIEAIKVNENVFMLKGQGGNIGVFIGDDGVFIIDDQFAHLSAKIESKIKELSDKPITFLVNTHHHGDHTGGNENMANLGATIISHDNVRNRLSRNQTSQGNLLPKKALPVITFNDKLNLYFNGEQVLVFHAENAHTDGDVLLYFTESNVLHTGDNYFQGRYPYIDLESGGSVMGYIEAVKRALIVIDDDTKIIPGHGDISNKKEYLNFLKMLESLKNSVVKEIENGKTEEQVATNEDLTKTYDDLGYSWGFINSEKIRRTFFKSLSSR